MCVSGFGARVEATGMGCCSSTESRAANVSSLRLRRDHGVFCVKRSVLIGLDKLRNDSIVFHLTIVVLIWPSWSAGP